MEKWSESLQRRLTKLEEKIESLLVMELEEQNSNESAAEFEPIHDVKTIRTLSRELPDDLEDLTLILFSRLSMFFEVGVLFERDAEVWKSQAYFRQGRFYGLTNENLEVKGGPEITTLQIVKAPALPFLKQLKIDGRVNNPEDLAAFMMRPHENVGFLLMTRLVGPWLKVHMDEIHREILKAFA